MEIIKSKYKNVGALKINNEYLSVTVLPQFGSKIASIYYYPKSYEILWQSNNEYYKKSKYGEIFESGEFSGFDEMFPSILECYYEEYPWSGIKIPDHGELWSIPWKYEVKKENKQVKLWVNGIRFPYLFKKEITLDKNKIKLLYSLENKSPFYLDYIWAAHPLFNISQYSTIVVPEGMNKIINSVAGPVLKEYGKIYDFPTATLENGKSLYLNHIQKRNSYGYQKYYFLGKVTEGWCKIIDHNKELSVTLHYPEEKVPYLGIWINEGGWQNQYNVALEPSTGAMDRIDSSKIWKMNSILKPYEIIDWYLEISIDRN